MPALGMGIVWFGYSLASWGYILIKGYNIKFTDWINPLHPYSGGWNPPPKIDNSNVLLPGGSSSTGSSTLPKLPPDPFGNPKPKTPPVKIL